MAGSKAGAALIVRGGVTSSAASNEADSAGGGVTRHFVSGTLNPRLSRSLRGDVVPAPT